MSVGRRWPNRPRRKIEMEDVADTARQEPGPVQAFVSCLIRWTQTNHPSIEYEQWGSISYFRNVDLPFYPRPGDMLYLSGCGPFAVTSAAYNVDQQYAEIHVESCTAGPSWDALRAKMVERGWEFGDAEGSAAEGN